MKYKRVVLRISGGIGNQLFQYGYALAEARRSGNHSKVIVLSYYQNHFWWRGTKYSALRKLRVQELLPEVATTIISDAKAHPALDWALRLRVFRKKAIRDLYSIVTGSIILDGYFQGIDDFEVTKSVLNEMRNLYNKTLLGNGIGSDKIEKCVIHVRAGDLLKQPWNQLCDSKYYQNAIDYMRNKFSVTDYDVITEDGGYAMGLLSGIEGVSINILEACDEVEDFNRIASYRYIVCANSTFSWWAAVLGMPINFCSPEYFYRPGDKPGRFENEYCIKY